MAKPGRVNSNGTGGAMPARRQLARFLRQARTTAGYTQEDAAVHIELSLSTMHRIEAAKGGHLKRAEIASLCTLYGVTDTDIIENLKSLAAAAKVKGPYQPYRDVVTGEFDMYLGLEGEACELLTYENEFVPGLLQTEAYARAVIRDPGTGSERDEAEIDKRVSLRLERQNVLRRRPNPLKMEVLLSETVLRRPMGGAHVMVEQLRHINEVGRLPNVSVRVVPLLPYTHRGLFTGQFIILRFPDGEPPIAYSDGFLGDSYFKDEDEIVRYEGAFADISKHALSRAKSRAFIEEVAKELTRND